MKSSRSWYICVFLSLIICALALSSRCFLPIIIYKISAGVDGLLLILSSISSEIIISWVGAGSWFCRMVLEALRAVCAALRVAALVDMFVFIQRVWTVRSGTYYVHRHKEIKNNRQKIAPSHRCFLKNLHALIFIFSIQDICLESRKTRWWVAMHIWWFVIVLGVIMG